MKSELKKREDFIPSFSDNFELVEQISPKKIIQRIIKMVDDIDVVFKEPKTFEETHKPVIYLSWLMGTGVCRPGDWKKVTIFIKLIHFTMCSIVIAYGIIDYFRIGGVIRGETYKMIYYTNKAVIYVTSYYYVIFGAFHYKKWQKLVERFNSIDRKIRREISINDRSTKIRQLMALGVIVLLGPVSLVIHVLYYQFTNPADILASDLLLYYTIAQSLATNSGFDIMVCSIYQRFKIVNKLIKQIGDSYAAPWIVLKIQRLRELHYGICGLVNILNGAHGIHLLLSSANSFMMVVGMLFRIYIGAVESNFGFIVANNVIWIVYASQFAVNCYVCTLASREAKRTGVYIHDVGLKNNQLTNKRLYSSNAWNRRSLSYQTESKTYDGSCVQNEIAYFSSQLEQNPVGFTACEFFTLNNELLQSFIGVITTYLIILIQFYHPPTNNVRESSLQSTNVTTFNTTAEYYTTTTEQNYTVS